MFVDEIRHVVDTVVDDDVHPSRRGGGVLGDGGGCEGFGHCEGWWVGFLGVDLKGGGCDWILTEAVRKMGDERCYGIGREGER